MLNIVLNVPVLPDVRSSCAELLAIDTYGRLCAEVLAIATDGR